MASTPKIRDYFTKENPHGLPVHPRPQSREGKQDCMRGAVADTLGMITEVSEVRPIQLTGKSSVYRNVFIKNLSGDMLKVTLWGNRALQFSYEPIYDQQKQDVIVVLFVGCLPKEYKACHWYFNPSITEAEPYYERIHNENIKIELPMLSNEPVTFPNPIEREDKELKVLLESDPDSLPDEGCKCTVTITRILDDQPWWYRACNACPNKPSMQSAVSSCRTCGSTDAILRYKLNFMASDGTAEMRMFCFDNIAKRIIGKPCASLLTSATSTSNIPPDLAAIVSLKFTFAVVYNEMSFQVSEKELFIKSVIASHGRDLTFPSPKLKIPVQPSTPTQLLGAAKQQVSPSSSLSKLSTAISPENSPQTEDNLQNEDQNILAFESPQKRARRKSLKFDCDKNLHDE
ncbi:hypothetical protein Zm00014a_005131 [Zea mays]|uniref:Replication factor A C-terminal domain-containing protein n=1 Tax=Zea mays TaxID=4577 RepID=A0A3L6FX64_MAIZE|nr:hypothetical protein Zm00014a_005131 [Zea mays]